MGFYMMPEYFPSDNLIENVAEVRFGSLCISITCFPKTGTLFMNGLFAPGHLSVRDSLEWYTHKSLDDYKIDILYFQLKSNNPRPAHKWEYNTFLNGHWRHYAKSQIQINVTFTSKHDGYFSDEAV
jgi:hypothetical protein